MVVKKNRTKLLFPTMEVTKNASQSLGFPQTRSPRITVSEHSVRCGNIHWRDCGRRGPVCLVGRGPEKVSARAAAKMGLWLSPTDPAWGWGGRGNESEQGPHTSFHLGGRDGTEK